jgi:hypothetical protein
MHSFQPGIYYCALFAIRLLSFRMFGCPFTASENNCFRSGFHGPATSQLHEKMFAHRWFQPKKTLISLLADFLVRAIALGDYQIPLPDESHSELSNTFFRPQCRCLAPVGASPRIQSMRFPTFRAPLVEPYVNQTAPAQMSHELERLCVKGLHSSI